MITLNNLPMTKIQITARFKIKDGQLTKFTQLAHQCIAIVNEKEKGKGGNLQYDWFLNEESGECLVRETYTDSDALLIHMGNVGEPLGALMQISDLSIEFCGKPSPELVAATEGLKVDVYSYLGGMV
jgi:quinol monooxygenase YgiN